MTHPEKPTQTVLCALLGLAVLAPSIATAQPTKATPTERRANAQEMQAEHARERPGTQATSSREGARKVRDEMKTATGTRGVEMRELAKERRESIQDRVTKRREMLLQEREERRADLDHQAKDRVLLILERLSGNLQNILDNHSNVLDKLEERLARAEENASDT
ncbi:MAG: hypothetical protein WD175_01380, partial [Candidatus Paceibacterota bacterium]